MPTNKEIDTKEMQLEDLVKFMKELGYTFASQWWSGDNYFISYNTFNERADDFTPSNKQAIRITFNNAVMLYNLTPWHDSVIECAIRFGIDVLKLSYALNVKKFQNCKLQTTKRAKEVVCNSNWLKPNIQINTTDMMLEANIENSFITYLEERSNLYELEM